jgi:hypothetical protein
MQHPGGHVPRRIGEKHHRNNCQQPADFIRTHQPQFLVVNIEQQGTGAKPARHKVRAMKDCLADDSDKLCCGDGELVDRHYRVS